MQKHHTSEQELSAEQLRHVVKQVRPSIPIQAYRVVGGRVELMLQGGIIEEAPIPNLSGLTVKELRQRARELALSGYSKMNKDELIEAIKKSN